MVIVVDDGDDAATPLPRSRRRPMWFAACAELNLIDCLFDHMQSAVIYPKLFGSLMFFVFVISVGEQ